jgi:hypothetical protein
VTTPDSTFHFWGCSEIRESLGVRAESERQLMERLETVPAESIYYHTVRCLLRRQVAPTPYPGDFATWVALEVRDPVAAERLALSSPFDFPDIEAFRGHLLDILDDHLSRLPFAPRVILGDPFYFMRGHLASVPLELTAHDLPSFRRALGEVEDSTIYFHAVEAIGRLARPRGDFAAWVDGALGLSALAARMDEVDPFVASLSGVRAQIIEAVDDALEGGGRG